MSNVEPSLAVGISIDLRSARMEYEREGELADYTLRASNLDRDVQDVLERQQTSVDYKVDVVAVVGSTPSTKNGAQIIDWVNVALTPLTALGVAGCVKLVVQLIEACRTKIPTSYEVEAHGIKVKLSGPGASPQDMQILREMFRELLDSPAPRAALSAAPPVRVRALPRGG